VVSRQRSSAYSLGLVAKLDDRDDALKSWLWGEFQAVWLGTVTTPLASCSNQSCMPPEIKTRLIKSGLMVMALL